MNEQSASYKRILKSSSLIGGASIINILMGMIRTKVLALLLGSTGVGLSSLYITLMNAAASIAGMGLDIVGSRQIAGAIGKEDHHLFAVIRRSMYFGTLFLSIFGCVSVWLLRETLAEHVFADLAEAENIGWLSLGVALSVISASQAALIQGFRRIGDLARMSIYSAVLNTLLSITLIWYWGSQYLIFYVMVGPLTSFFINYFFILRLPKTVPNSIDLKEIVLQLQSQFRLGFPFIAAGLVMNLVDVWVRIEILEQLNLDAVGHMQAANAIANQYVGFVLSAMGADYYPHLSSIIHDKTASTRLINQQTEMALLLASPVFILMIGLAPWVIKLLYSPNFIEAAEVLRWLVLGDVLKVVSWPIAFVILAAGDGKMHFVTVAITVLLRGSLIKAGLSEMGLSIVGIAFLMLSAIYLLMAYVYARRRIGFGWTGTVVKLFSLTSFLCIVVALLSHYYWWGVYFSILLSMLFSLHSIRQLLNKTDLINNSGRLGGLLRSLSKLIPN
jgi:PST family polysaccharide transporter